MRRFWLVIGGVGLIFWLSLSANAQDASLDELLESVEEFEVSVASIKKMSIRESPGIVSRITGEEIRNAGARDLIDVLRLVPGFSFGTDVWNTVGPGVRGNWGLEGKVLLLLNGFEMNERLYSTLEIGHRFSVDQIERIEIIRGPGSAVYGGFAELAVVNIITKTGAELQGATMSGTYSQMDETYDRRHVNLSVGQAKEEWSVALHAFAGQGVRSEETYTDVYGDSFDMTDASALEPLQINLGFTYKNLQMRFLYERYRIETRDFFDANLPDILGYEFETTAFDIHYDWQVSDKLHVIPRFTYQYQDPYGIFKNLPADYGTGDPDVQQIKAGLQATYDPTPQFNIILGTEFYEDKAVNEVGNLSFNNGADVSYTNIAALGQALAKFPFATVTVGARYDKHEEYGASFVPRFAVTRAFADFHVKLLASTAFRAPGLANIELGEDIEPEETTVYEFEAGYRFTPQVALTANLFDTTIDEPIVYFYDSETDTEGYRNAGSMNTRGIEAELRGRYGAGYTYLTYSFYRAEEIDADTYRAGDKEDAVLAFPQHKITLNSHYRLTNRISVNPSLIFSSETHGYYTTDAADELVLKTYDSQALLNVFVRCQDCFADGLTLGAGVYDALDEGSLYIQPYDGYHAPLPGAGRSVLINASYHFEVF